MTLKMMDHEGQVQIGRWKHHVPNMLDFGSTIKLLVSRDVVVAIEWDRKSDGEMITRIGGAGARCHEAILRPPFRLIGYVL